MKLCCDKARVKYEGDELTLAWKTICEEHGEITSCYLCNQENRTTERCRDCILKAEDFFYYGF